MYINGYSFGDEHINSSIRTALSENIDIQIVIIDPSFKVEEFDFYVMLRIFAASNNMHAGPPTNLAKDVHGFLGGRVIVHAKTFKAYMEDCLNELSHF